MEIQERISQLSWDAVTEDLNDKGYSSITKVLTDAECEGLIKQYDNPDLYRKTISMEHYRFGMGEYKYYQYPLPGLFSS